MLQLRQLYVCSTGFLKETPQAFNAASNRTNKCDHHGYTPEQIWVGNVFVSDFLELKCSAELDVRRKFFSFR